MPPSVGAYVRVRAVATILVIDDDDHLREVVRYALAREGFDVQEAADGEAAWAMLEHGVFDLLVLDVAMPRLDGFALCRRIRERSDVPIVFLSSRGDEIDRVLGLDLGGDDYVTKPFSTRELVSRVRARLRGKATAEVRAGALRLAPDRHRAWVGKAAVDLTATEFRLLAALANRPDRVLDRDELAALAYTDGRSVSGRTVDSHLRRIRAKLRVHGVDPIETVHGVGFRLRGRQ
jgi:two-component system OmpR family response regulator